MGIHTNLRDRCTDCWCDGCGERVQIAHGWHDARRLILSQGWISTATDYGDPRGPAWELFCCKECMDDED